MEPRYDHTKYEKEIYESWEKSGAFQPRDTKNEKRFTIIMPPPNASDPLHIGHAREVATQDTLIRYHRMRGESTLWLPGADHAGIETQFVFERKLKEKGQSRFDFDRKTLYQMIWADVQSNKKTMQDQLKRLGASCDWTRFKFTLDADIVKIVYQTFKTLYDAGLVYRGERIVNYCPRCGTNFSQLEVDAIERDDELYYLDYKTVTVATTRPETIFADVAVAVNPKDPRYPKLAGLTAKLPLINRELPIVTDNLVDPEFGTGALKITPGHDATDFEIGRKHLLPILTVIDETGKMINTPEKYVGLKAEVARAEVVKDLRARGLVKKVEKIHHLVGTCYRDHGLIEPTVSKQWFIKVEPLTKLALAAIKNKEVKFVAKKYQKIAIHWLKNLKDWNISRQIVWGIRIPAWRCDKCLNWTITDGPAPAKCAGCGYTKLIQDPDTFDTWFSSGQWPFATLKASPFKNDFKYFYPTTVMDPSYDILPFWVIRMLMLGLYRTGKVPFTDVLLHGLVRDKNGVKISKSKGNIIDPIEMADKYGADALRIALIWGVLVENDNSLAEENINAQRKFSNKIWNAARFVLANKSKNQKSKIKNQKYKLKIKNIIKETTQHLDNYRLNQAAEVLYSSFWHWFCDICIEEAKAGKIDSSDLKWGLENFLKLLHPFAPFVTEAVWSQGFAQNEKDLLISSPWPRA